MCASIQALQARCVWFTDHDSHQSLGHDVSSHGALLLNLTENPSDHGLLLDPVHLSVTERGKSYFIHGEVRAT